MALAVELGLFGLPGCPLATESSDHYFLSLGKINKTY
jgi:hypothetical protein